MRKDFYQVYDEYFAEPVQTGPVVVETPVETFKPSSEPVAAQATTIVDPEIEVKPVEVEDNQDGNGTGSEPIDE